MKYVIKSDFTLYENTFTVRTVSATLLITLHWQTNACSLETVCQGDERHDS